MKRHERPKNQSSPETNRQILLMGPPNVGKSVFFSAFTNIHAVSSNYAGTTVSYLKGPVRIGSAEYVLVDVPGTYCLSASSPAEALAVSFLSGGPRAILFVLSAADLEGGVKLLLEVLDYGIPVVAALNLMDIAVRKGYDIHVKLLEQELGVPVVPTVAVKRQGFGQIRERLGEVLSGARPACTGNCTRCKSCPRKTPKPAYWERAKEIAARCVRRTFVRTSRLDRFGDLLLKPWPGVPVSILILLLSLGIVVGAGKGLCAGFLLPLVSGGIVPFFERVFSNIPMPEVLSRILIGEYGIFRISFEWIFELILPYVILFQLVFAFLEDSGILPRMAVLFDNLMRRLGVQGGSLIHIMLGFGCAVPAIISTRGATTRKERLMVASIVCFSVPCISQTGALISLLSGYSYWMLLTVFLTAALVLALTSVISGRIIKGRVEPLILEIPNLLVPEPRAYFKKFLLRVRQFLVEAEGPMLAAVLIAALLAETGLLQGISAALRPLVSGWLGLPPEASMSLILGIIRREMSVAPLLSMGLDGIQMYVGAVVSLVYLPCLSVFGILVKEFGARVALCMMLTTTTAALLLGGVLNLIIRFVIGLFA